MSKRKEVAGCVYPLRYLNWDKIYTLEQFDEDYHYWLNSPEYKTPDGHMDSCPMQDYPVDEEGKFVIDNINDNCDCYCYDFDMGSEDAAHWYADAPFIQIPDDSLLGFALDAPGASIFFKISAYHQTLQLVLSPQKWHRGLCSPCYPGQGDSENADGNLWCYKLPKEYFR